MEFVMQNNIRFVLHFIIIRFVYIAIFEQICIKTLLIFGVNANKYGQHFKMCYNVHINKIEVNNERF